MNRHPEYKYKVKRTNGLWIYLEDADNSGWGREVFDWTSDKTDNGPVELMLRIKDKTGWHLVDLGDNQYKFSEDRLEIIFQWDDLFGFVIVISDTTKQKPVIDFLEEFF